MTSLMRMLKWEGMRNAYALLGLSFIIVFLGAYLIFQKAHAPAASDSPPVKETEIKETHE